MACFRPLRGFFCYEHLSFEHLTIFCFLLLVTSTGLATCATAATVATAPTGKGGLTYAVALQVPVLTMIDVAAALLHAKSLDWTTVWLLLPLSFVGMGVGQQLMDHPRMTDGAARILVGTLLLGILLLRVWKDIVGTLLPQTIKEPLKDHDHQADVEHGHTTTKSPPRPPRSTNTLKSIGWAFVVGLIGGIATMLTNSCGPILNVYLLSVRKLNPSAYIGTRAMFFCFVNLGKIPLRVFSGSLGWPMLPLATLLGTVSVIGVVCAKPIMLRINENTFVKLELAVVAFAGVRLLWMGIFAKTSNN